MKAKTGFTLVEILIVVVILGILAAIVIPQFTEASSQARESSLVSDLQTLRSQIELYKIHHNDLLPGETTGVTFEDAMTMYTDITGALVTPQAPGTNVYGRYMQKIPKNPFNDKDTVTVSGTPGSDLYGWNFNLTTGEIHPDDNEMCVTDGTTPHSSM